MTADKQRFEDHIGLVHMQAKFGFKWAQGAGLSMSYEDLYQEASLAFLLAAEGYDGEKSKFSTYYTKVCFSVFRKAIGQMTGVKNLSGWQRAEIADRKAENKRRGEAAEAPLLDVNYGLRPMQFSELGGEDMDDFDQILPSEARTPEELLEFKQNWQQATSKLSPLAQLVVSWLKEPPPELLRELSGQAAHADECTSKGVRRARGSNTGISIESIGKFLNMVTDLPKNELLLVEAELMELVNAI